MHLQNICMEKITMLFLIASKQYIIRAFSKQTNYPLFLEGFSM